MEEDIINEKVVHLIALIGVVLGQSKVGILLLFASFVLFNIKKKNKLINISLGIMAIGVLYLLGVFDVIIYRFQNTSFTTGRIRWWMFLQKNYDLQMHWITGYGERLTSEFISRLQNDYSQSYSSMIVTAALENPILIICYKYGIIGGIIWCYKVFGNTFIKLLKSKSLVLMAVYMIIVVDLNTFNQLIYNPDVICIFLVWTVMLKVFSQIVQEKTCAKRGM